MAKAKTAFAVCLMAAMALAPLDAKDFYTVEEFSAAEIDSGESVKIVDTLDEETQRKLVGACNKLKGKVALDLSACDFGKDEAKINFFTLGTSAPAFCPRGQKPSSALTAMTWKKSSCLPALKKSPATRFLKAA